ncbi:acetolactate synthase large subunit [Bacillus massiliigorillae]|uniref:acetolactate synthase large subunit n=1 Tax=Bacillus massiliigorillae TaxID=1243664 RepID=UPI0003A1C7D5|nr:acetolactate synthase large subunit [Bacillus massiliigorillae]
MLNELASTSKQTQRKKLSGANLLLNALKRENVEVMFGYPGGAVLPIYDSIYDAGIPHILTRHEQGAIHAAEGYARITGKPGVVITTSGPGATNIITGLADAMIDSIPLVIITGQVATSVIGSDAFQEADILGITTPITKYNVQVRNVEDIPRIIKEAFHIASTGRPGPVLIDIPKDMALIQAEVNEDPEIYLPGYQPTIIPNVLQIRKLLEAISTAKKPIILAGAGVLHAKASQQFKKFAEQQGIPVVHTLLGLGGFPADHPQYIGMVGMHGEYAANMALCECDLLINIGARFDDRVTSDLKSFASKAIVAHIDIDPAEIGKNVPTAIPVVGDAKEALIQLIKQNGKKSECEEWKHTIQHWKQTYPLYYDEDNKGLKPQKVIELLHKLTSGDATVVTDVGQHQMWTAQFYPFRQPHAWVTSGGFGTMGFGVPASIGAQIAQPEKTVVAIVGDGSFQMTFQELGVIAEMNLPIKIIIVNNYSLGMVRQQQELYYKERYSQSLLGSQPSFVKLADAYGIKSFVATTTTEAEAVLKEALAMPEPVLIDMRVEEMENVYPIVAPGKGLHEMEGYKQ